MSNMSINRPKPENNYYCKEIVKQRDALYDLSNLLLKALETISEGNTMSGVDSFTHADVIQKHYSIVRKVMQEAEEILQTL